MNTLVLGASGIIGQYMRLSVPTGINAIFCRHSPSPGYTAFNATNYADLRAALSEFEPNVVVNLAGESNTDTVERSFSAHYAVNVGLPMTLADMAHEGRFRLVHISSQAVFNGLRPPYAPRSATNAVNKYGRQKSDAERGVLYRKNTAVIRPTFVLGIRPDPSIGRANPIEQILGGQPKQVSDRWFSVSFAPDVARTIWGAVLCPGPRLHHAGVPRRTSRYQIALDLGLDVEPVSHDDFPGLAPRPIDTTYSTGEHYMSYEEGLADCRQRFEARLAVAA